MKKILLIILIASTHISTDACTAYFQSFGNCAGQNVNFYDLSSISSPPFGYITTWVWNFGDGTPNLVINFPANPNISHVFAGPALSYTVTLTITGNLGCTDSETQIIYLNQTPLANFTFPSLGNCSGQSVQFNDLSQTNGGGAITGWNWDFGDPSSGTNNLSTLQNPVHNFTSPGTFNVSLIVSNAVGCSDTIFKVISVNQTPGPVIAGPQLVCSGSAGNIYTTETGMANYLWNVSPGGSITSGGGLGDNYAIVTWNQSGMQTVNVNYTNTYGCAAVSPAIYNVTVNPLPGAIITPGGPTTFCNGNTVTLTASTANSYLWSNGASTQSITVSTSGSYSVTVTNGNGCSSTSSPTVVTVLPTPVANAGADQVIGYGASTTLIGSASNGSGNYTWHWEPASLLLNSNVQNPVTVNLTSSVQFTLTVTDLTNGCTGNDQVLVTVTGGPLSVDATATPDIACPGDAVQLLAITSGGSGNNTFTWTSNPPGFNATVYNPIVLPNVSATYFVNVNDGYSIVSDSVFVTINPLPGIPATPAGPDTVNLYSVSSSAYNTTGDTAASTYIWEISPESAGTISGTETTGTVLWNPNFIGEAIITVKSVNSCGESPWSPGVTTTIVNTITGITSESKENEPKIYPNPSDGTLTIMIEGRSDISILNATGLLLKTVKDVTSGPLDMTSFSKGVYILLIKTDDNEFFLKKVVIF